MSMLVCMYFANTSTYLCAKRQYMYAYSLPSMPLLYIGVPTPVAQSRIQECLAQLSEADYNSIMTEYKVCTCIHSICAYV